MRYQSALTLLFAGCCLLAVVNLAASLDTAVQGHPDDVIDVDTDSLPLPSDQADQLKEALQSGGQAGNGDERTRSSGAPSGSREQRNAGSGGDTSQRADGPAGESDGGSGSGPSGSGEQSDSGETEDGYGPGGVQGWLALLREWFERLLGAVGYLLLLGGVAALVYKRALVRDRLESYLRRGDAAADSHTSPGPSSRRPENGIERAWLEMVSSADTDVDPSATPREHADSMVQAGLQREPVRKLTALFEDVRYGDRSVTDDEVRTASTYLQQSFQNDD